MLHRHLINNSSRRLVPAALLWLLGASLAVACPFCTVESRTLTEEINSSDAVVLAKLVADAPPLDVESNEAGGFGPADPDTGKATFEVVDVLRGGDRVQAAQQIKVVYFGEGERDKTFLISGIGVENNVLEWTTPLPLSTTAIDYIRELPGIAATGVGRVTFFYEYLENDDPLLAQDAYDEFARAPYEDVKALKPQLDHDQLVAWIQSSDVNPSRRRLYLTMLGVCGSERDLAMLENMIVSDYSTKKPLVEQLVATGQALGGPVGLGMWTEMLDLEERQKKLGLDATIGCYLALRGPDGLDLIDERFLKNPKVEYSHAYMTIMALRTLGEVGGVVPQERLLASMRLLLDNDEFADQVIPDLARWEDWSVLDRLVQMYKQGDEKSYVRQPVVTYLTVASEQPGDVGARARTALAELEQLDPEGVKRAQSLMAFGFLARARGTSPATGATRPDAKTDIAPAGFEASAADLAAGDADSSEIPDPASYDDAATETEPEEMPETESVDDSAPDVTSDAVAAAEIEPSPAPEALSRPLVIGVPLAGMLLMMTLYWLILRWGAV